jgi:hypothetical protein
MVIIYSNFEPKTLGESYGDFRIWSLNQLGFEDRDNLDVGPWIGDINYTGIYRTSKPKPISTDHLAYEDGSKPWYLLFTPSHSWDLWMFIPLKMVSYRYWPIPIWALHIFISGRAPSQGFPQLQGLSKRFGFSNWTTKRSQRIDR